MSPATGAVSGVGSGQLVETVESSHPESLCEGGVIEDRVDEVIDLDTETERHLPQ